MATIDEFKANLVGGGARANQFRITFNTPGAIAVALDIRRTSFLTRTGQLPGNTVGEVVVPFRGRALYLAGDREYETWTTTVLNDTDFLIYRGLERWMNGMNNMTDNEGLTNPSDYQVDIFVDHLDRNGSTLKSYTLRGAFPTALDDIALNYGTNNTIEEFSCSFTYQYFETDTTT